MERYPSNIVNTAIPRLEKAFNSTSNVEFVDEKTKTALVRSSDGKKLYEVSFERNDCNCPDNQYRHLECKHIKAVILRRKVDSGEIKI